MVRYLLVPLVLSLSAPGALAGAWTLERGETHAYVTSSFTYGDHGFDDAGRLVAVPEYRKFTLDATLEYGIRPWLTGIVKGELREERDFGEIWRDTGADIFFDDGTGTPHVLYGERTRSFGDIAGGARARLLAGERYAASAQGLVSTGSIDSTGDGAPSQGPYVEARALFGIGGPVWGRHAFLDAQAAYRFRLDAEDSDEAVLDLTVGAHLLPRWMVLAQTFSTYEMDGETHYTKAGGSVVYAFSDTLRIEVGALGTVYGRNAVREIGGKVGFWWLH